VSTTLEAARLLTKTGAKPKRTIRFMLWSGEEQGLLGSRAYIKAHPEENAKISAVLVHDGGTNYASG
jgi:Zn-dependent M28 family amino/carboxypeptidase